MIVVDSSAPTHGTSQMLFKEAEEQFSGHIEVFSRACETTNVGARLVQVVSGA